MYLGNWQWLNIFVWKFSMDLALKECKVFTHRHFNVLKLKNDDKNRLLKMYARNKFFKDNFVPWNCDCGSIFNWKPSVEKKFSSNQNLPPPPFTSHNFSSVVNAGSWLITYHKITVAVMLFWPWFSVWIISWSGKKADGM